MYNKLEVGDIVAIRMIFIDDIVATEQEITVKTDGNMVNVYIPTFCGHNHSLRYNNPHNNSSNWRQTGITYHNDVGGCTVVADALGRIVEQFTMHDDTVNMCKMNWIDWPVHPSTKQPFPMFNGVIEDHLLNLATYGQIINEEKIAKGSF